MQRRCRSVDSVASIETQPVEVGIFVVRHGSPFAFCRPQRIGPSGQRCFFSLTSQKLCSSFIESTDLSIHVSQLVCSSFYQLWQDRETSHSIPKSMPSNSVISRIDYCNSFLAGRLACQMEHFQSIVNYAVRITYEWRLYCSEASFAITHNNTCTQPYRTNKNPTR